MQRPRHTANTLAAPEHADREFLSAILFGLVTATAAVGVSLLSMI